ncbi:hypothetical protein OAR19_00135 [bacterium]|nr:hypothetical protein [bacterium]
MKGKKRLKEKLLMPNDFGKKYLTEECQKINISDLLSNYQIKFKELLLTTQIEALGVDIELATSQTYFKGNRYWFKCPICERRSGIIYKHPIRSIIGCRKCLNLDYRKHRYKGMVENDIMTNH